MLLTVISVVHHHHDGKSCFVVILSAFGQNRQLKRCYKRNFDKESEFCISFL